jgi:hypothetical protein
MDSEEIVAHKDCTFSIVIELASRIFKAQLASSLKERHSKVSPN